MQRAFGQKRARSLVSAAKSGRRCRRGRRPRWFRLVEIPKMRRSTTAALNERGYIFVGAPGCRKQFRGAVDVQESSRSLRGKSSRLRPSTTLHSRSGHFSPN
jgi:hypothetical protein